LNLIDSGNFDGLSPEPLKELIALADDLKTRGVQLRSVTEGINTTTLGGELVFHLFAAIAQFERNLIRERTRAGLTSAKARGKVGGRPKKMKPGDIAAAKALLRDPEITVEEAAKRLGVHPVTPHIVVATDFSEASRYALESTARIFPERKLTLFHASEAPLSGRMMNAESHRRAYRERAMEECQEFLKKVRKPDIWQPPSVLIEDGAPHFLLRDYVRAMDVDLVVLGRHGRNAIVEMVVGSVGKAILDEVPCDVLVLQEPRAANPV
jgi:nucleotide-binding universal stress UspA family protein